MVNYNATVRNQGTGIKTDTTSAGGLNYNPNDPNSHFSQGNGLLFDSKFDRPMSGHHHVRQQSTSNNNNMTTLNNQPLSVENPTMSPASSSQQWQPAQTEQ